MSEPEPVAAAPPVPAVPNAAAVAHASMLNRDPNDPATRVAFLETNLETLGRLLDGHIADLQRTRRLIDVLLNKSKEEKPQRRKRTP